jgi:hypothetical protein
MLVAAGLLSLGEPQTMVKASPDPFIVTWPPSMFHHRWVVSLAP